jgi:hypothetical protein
MKKRLVILGIALTMLFQVIPTTVFAANETSADSTIYYTYVKENHYEIEIPQMIDLDSSPYMYITAKNISLPSNKMLAVSIPEDIFSFNGNLMLSCISNLAKQMQCQMFATNPDTLIEHELTKENNRVITFKENDTPYTRKGTIRFAPISQPNLPEDRYKGYLRFVIEIVDMD